MEDGYWNTDYWHSMDKTQGREGEEIIKVSPTQLGISHGIGDPLQGLRGNIFAGASRVELGFMGAGKGSRHSPTGWTPESVSRTEREDIRLLAKINEVELSTHASPNVSLSGLTDQGFKEEQQEKALFEVKKAIEFAADTAGGGPVVLHAQEFPRSIAEHYKEQKFSQFPGEETKSPVYLADSYDGRIIALRKDTKVAVPKDGWDNPKRKEDGTIEWEVKPLNDLYLESLKKGEKRSFADFYKEYERKDLELNRGEERRWGLDANEAHRSYENIKRFREQLEEQSKVAPEQAQYSAMKLLEENRKMPSPGDPEHKEFVKDPIKYLKEKVEERVKNQAESLSQISRSYGSRYEEAKDRLSRIKPIEEVGMQRSAEALARAALFGYNVEKTRNLKRPIMLSAENYEPEVFGGHPQEMKQLIQQARKDMVKELIKKDGYDISEKEAKQIAEDRIRMTFDIGHLNMWRKFFQGTDEEFKGWVREQVDDLTKNNILGHVHITDNFGYHDEHLTPGEGSAPIKEFLKRLEEKGYKGNIIAEPGGQPEGQLFRSLTGAWKLSNYPIYRVDSEQRSWSDIEGSYFGRTGSPNFVVGDYAMSKDWTLWSETPLE